MWYEKIQSNSVLTFFQLSDDEFENLKQYVVSAEEGEVVVRQGAKLEAVYIPLSTTFSQEVHDGLIIQKIGDITVGRSINLYCYLRNIPLPYLSRTNQAGDYLALPRTVFDQMLEANPLVKSYLVKVTEEPDLRNIAKEWTQAGVDQSVVFQIIGASEVLVANPQQFLSHHGQQAHQMIYLMEGKFLVHDSKNSKKSWIMPLKSWHFFSECLNSTAFTYSLASSEKSKYLAIPSEQLLLIKESDKAEFEKFVKFISEGTEAPIEDDGGVELELDELFDGAVETNLWRWSFPFVKQNDEMDCGPACLSMVSEYFGKKMSIQFWRSRLSTDRTGTSLYDLAITTEKTGFISHCLEVENLRSVDQFMFPFIMLRKYHYMVVYKVKKDTAIIGDPAYGLREVPLSELEQGMEHVGLFLKPNSDFYQLEPSASAWTHYLKLFAGLEREMALAFACSVLGVLFSIVPPLISQFALDEVLAQKDIEMLWILLAVCGGVTIISNLINWAKNYYFIYIMNKFSFRSTSVFIQKMFSLPYSFFSTRHVGDFTHRMAEMNQLRSFVTTTLFKVSLNMLSLFLYTFVMLMINYKLAILVILLMPMMLIIPMLFTKKLDQYYQQIFKHSSEQSSYLTDLVEGVSVIKTSGAETVSRIRFEDKMLELIKSQNKFAMANSNVDFISGTYLQAAQFIIMGLGVYFGIKGQLSAGQVISLSLLANQMFAPLQSIANEWEQFVRVKSVLSRLNDIFLTQSEKTNDKVSTRPKGQTAIKGEIEFKNVWFRYGGEGSDWVLKNINFKIEPGQKVAIVGPSGSGKSTIAALLTRMFEPTEGQIFIDGRDYRSYDLNWLRTQIGLLQQDNRLFNGTLAENIAISDIDSNEERLLASAENASAVDLVERRSGSWNQYVPHGGIGYSGGEKQKVALMRLFYKQPSLIILDEATSALDGISEREIIFNIQNILKSQTVLNIAHRYSTVAFSEFALVMREGRVAGYGTLDHLKQSNKVFQDLFGLNQNENKFLDEQSDKTQVSDTGDQVDCSDEAEEIDEVTDVNQSDTSDEPTTSHRRVG
jgi:ATP-binding cassette, subfamily B, bacterial HlyB/CyaB